MSLEPETAAVETSASDKRLERRASDVMFLKFDHSALKALLPSGADISESDIETIDMDSILPPGHDEYQPRSSARTHPTLSLEQNRERIRIVKFKQSFENYELTTRLTQVNYSSIKRGDIIEIKTIVGSMFFRILDRIRGEKAGIGEILCECHYDLMDQWSLVHAASITLPVCTKQHVIENADGSKRFACRSLKMQTEEELPENIRTLLSEKFFTEIVHYINPVPEKLRFIDVARWMMRVARKIKAIIEENNRKEREKKLQRQEMKRQKAEEKQRKREEK